MRDLKKYERGEFIDLIVAKPLLSLIKPKSVRLFKYQVQFLEKKHGNKTLSEALREELDVAILANGPTEEIALEIRRKMKTSNNNSGGS